MNKINIFFINIDNFLANIDKNSLGYFLDGNYFRTEKRFYEFCLGRFLVKYVLKKYYNISEPIIVVDNNKPYIKDKSVKFSISHSKNMLVVAFFEDNIGVDVEFMRERNFDKLFEYCQVKYDGYSSKKEFFYHFWTRYEAEIKLSCRAKKLVTMRFFDDYMLSLAFDDKLSDVGDIKTRLNIYELVSPRDKTKPRELINLKLVIDNIRNENTVVAQEINTAQFDFR